MLNKRYNRSFKRDIRCFDFHSNFLVSFLFYLILDGWMFELFIDAQPQKGI